MSRIKSKNTKPEIILFIKLKKEGLKYKKHFNIPGKPDVVFVKNKLAIFVDGEFWHGKDFDNWSQKLTPFWNKKISDNINRDKKNDKELRKLGWSIIHIWGKDVISKPDLVFRKIERRLLKINILK